MEGGGSLPSLKTLIDRIPGPSIVVASECPIARPDIEHSGAGLDQPLDRHTRQPLIERHPLTSLVSRFENAVPCRHKKPTAVEQNPANRIIRERPADRPPGCPTIGTAKDASIERARIDATIRIDRQHAIKVLRHPFMIFEPMRLTHPAGGLSFKPHDTFT